MKYVMVDESQTGGSRVRTDEAGFTSSALGQRMAMLYSSHGSMQLTLMRVNLF